MNSNQKPHIEQSHRLIRTIVPKGIAFDDFTQEMTTEMASHISSYILPSTQNRSPQEAFQFYFGLDPKRLFGLRAVPRPEVTLKPTLFPSLRERIRAKFEHDLRA